MKLKSELYKQEQNDIINKIITILQLDNQNSFILYHLDNDFEKQTQIQNLIPNIRKYFSFSTIIGASDPAKAKRPYLSIIRQIIKGKYKMISLDHRIKIDEIENIRTKKYIFIKI